MWEKSVVVINILVCSEHDNVTKNDPVWYKILHVLSLLISISGLDESWTNFHTLKCGQETSLFYRLTCFSWVKHSFTQTL